MRNHKWLIRIALAGTIVGAAGILLFLNGIFDSEWGEKKAAVEAAYRQTMMTKADRVEPYVGDRPYTIVYGEDKIGQPMIVWVSGADVHSEYATNGISADKAAALTKEKDPNNQIIRTTPGKLGDDYIWEIYYKRKADGGDQYFYDYYRFADGILIDTYKLGKASS